VFFARGNKGRERLKAFKIQRIAFYPSSRWKRYREAVVLKLGKSLFEKDAG